jgi:hypothetical protein
VRTDDPNTRLPFYSPPEEAATDVVSLDQPAGQALAVALAGCGLTATGIRETMEYAGLVLRCERHDATHGRRRLWPDF